MEKNYGWWLPIDASAHGHQIDLLLNILNVVIAVLFLGWLTFLLYTLFRFRARPGHKADYHEKHFKLPTYLEIGIVTLEVLLLAAFSVPIWYHLKKDIPKSSDTVLIRVVAQQFAWNIHYPGTDGVFGRVDMKLMDSSNPLGLDRSDPAAKDDIVTINQLHVPVGRPVSIQLSSKDVIHSFDLPVMRIKQDAIPGYVAPVWFEAKKTGNFEIACSQLCGLGHYRMRGFFIVDTPEDFKKWMDERAAEAASS